LSEILREENQCISHLRVCVKLRGVNLTSPRPVAIATVAIVTLLFASSSMDAQWIRHPTAGVPKTRDGKPNLLARTPRAADGKPDFSGVWQNDGYGPPGGEGLGATPKTVLLEYACLENEKDVPHLVGK